MTNSFNTRISNAFKSGRRHSVPAEEAPDQSIPRRMSAMLMRRPKSICQTWDLDIQRVPSNLSTTPSLPNLYSRSTSPASSTSYFVPSNPFHFTSQTSESAIPEYPHSCIKIQSSPRYPMLHILGRKALNLWEGECVGIFVVTGTSIMVLAEAGTMSESIGETLSMCTKRLLSDASLLFVIPDASTLCDKYTYNAQGSYAGIAFPFVVAADNVNQKSFVVLAVASSITTDEFDKDHIHHFTSIAQELEQEIRDERDVRGSLEGVMDPVITFPSDQWNQELHSQTPIAMEFNAQLRTSLPMSPLPSSSQSSEDSFGFERKLSIGTEGGIGMNSPSLEPITRIPVSTTRYDSRLLPINSSPTTIPPCIESLLRLSIQLIGESANFNFVYVLAIDATDGPVSSQQIRLLDGYNIPTPTPFFDHLVHLQSAVSDGVLYNSNGARNDWASGIIVPILTTHTTSYFLGGFVEDASLQLSQQDLLFLQDHAKKLVYCVNGL